MSDRTDLSMPESYANLDKLKKQVSMEIGVELSHGSKVGSPGIVLIHRCGDVGGNMVKRMIEEHKKTS